MTQLINLPSSKPAHSASVNLGTEASTCLSELQLSLGAVIGAVRPSVKRASELERVLGTDKRLSWSVFTAATTRDFRELISLLPGSKAINKFFEAACTRGVPQSIIDRASVAFKSFEQLVAEHADERDAFQLMVEDLLPREDRISDEVELRNKRSAYRANALLWGIQIRTMTVVSILRPGSSPETLDRINVSGKTGIRQNRLHCPLHIQHQFAEVCRPDEKPVLNTASEALDPSMVGSPDKVPLMPRFCSQPTPEFRTVIDANGFACQRLVSRGLGASGEMTHYFGNIERGEWSNPRLVKGAEIPTFSAFRFPTELFIQDILLHESVWDGQHPTLRLTAEHAGPHLDPQNENIVPLREQVEMLGNGIEAAQTLDLPRHVELLEYAFDRAGWNAKEFRVFRCRIEYPLLNSLLLLSFR